MICIEMQYKFNIQKLIHITCHTTNYSPTQRQLKFIPTMKLLVGNKAFPYADLLRKI